MCISVILNGDVKQKFSVFPAVEKKKDRNFDWYLCFKGMLLSTKDLCGQFAEHLIDGLPVRGTKLKNYLGFGLFGVLAITFCFTKLSSM